MIVFRLSKKKYKDQLSCDGASLNGQRWNSEGIEVTYTADSRALVNAEVAVHIPLGILPKDYYMVEIEIPASVQVYQFPIESLTLGWDSVPNTKDSQVVGDRFVSENRYAVLRVPSVVVKGDFNFILSPKHKGFYKIKILSTLPFPFDPRYS